ncbi:MAG: hypothetical protein HXY52_08875 [Nitrospirae bacterium]|jgi:hypothetical protein|nr:hypothetical protein [Nitrospirota bacterium]
MRKINVLLFAFILFSFLLICSKTYASQISKPDRSEIIEEVSTVTGLTTDIVSLVLSENPKLLDDIGDSVFTVKIINLFAEAKDVEAFEDLYEYSLDKVLTKSLPPQMTFFLTAVRAYKTSLEMVRDYMVIPAFDEKMYSRYFETRLEQIKQGDMSLEAKQYAFSAATIDKSSGSLFPDRGYYVVKNKMFEDIIKAKGYNPKLIGTDEKLGLHLWKQIDEFWMNRMEARLNHELIKKGRKEIINSVWKNSSKQINAIKVAASKIQEIKEVKEKHKEDIEKKQNSMESYNSEQKDEKLRKLQNIFEAQFSKDGKLTYSKPWQYDEKNKCYTFSYCYKGSLGDTWCWDDVCVTQGQAQDILKRGSWK